MKLKLFLLLLVSLLFSFSGVAQDVSGQDGSSSNEEGEIFQIVVTILFFCVPDEFEILEF